MINLCGDGNKMKVFDEDMKNKTNMFLAGLEKLTRETGLAVGSCGCCLSVYLEIADTTSDRAGYACKIPPIGSKLSNNEEWYACDTIKWVDPADDFDWKTLGKNIYKSK